LHVLSTPPAFVLSQDQTLRECFPVIGIASALSGTRKRNNLPVHSVLADVFFKGTSSRPNGRRRGINISGVDFWHAVEFSRNGRFLCTHPLGLSSGRFPSVFHFVLLFLLSCVSDSIRLFRVRFPRCLSGSRSGLSAFAFPFPAVPTLSDPFGPDSQSAGLVFAAVGPFRRLKL
jgi:hypothetical protein